MLKGSEDSTLNEFYSKEGTITKTHINKIISVVIMGIMLASVFASTFTMFLTNAAVTEHEVSASVRDVFIADVNMDGHNDIIAGTTNWAGAPAITVLMNDGSGNFPLSGTPEYGDDMRNDYFYGTSDPECLFVEDVDGINGPDILLTIPNDNLMLLILNDGTGFFDNDTVQWNGPNATIYATSNRPMGIFVKDLDEDTWKDVVITNQDDGTVSIFKNDGVDRLFDDDIDPWNGNGINQVNCDVGQWPRRVYVEDIDGVNGPDIITANEDWGSSLTTLLNDGAGNFPTSGTSEYDGDRRDDYYTYSGNYDVFVSDIDGDSDNDTVMTAPQGGSIKVLFNDGTGFFDDDDERYDDNMFLTEYSAITPTSIHVMDLKEDVSGDLDVITTQGDYSRADAWINIMFNDGSGGLGNSRDFSAEGPDESTNFPGSIYAGNLTGDDRPEVVVGSMWDNSVSILQLFNNDVAVDKITLSGSMSENGYYAVDQHNIEANIINDGLFDQPYFKVSLEIQKMVNPFVWQTVYGPDNSTMQLHAGESSTETWNHDFTDGTYQIIVRLWLDSDEYSGNDLLIQTFNFMDVADMMVSSISSPTDTISTSVHEINATIENIGNLDQNNVVVDGSIYEMAYGVPSNLYYNDLDGTEINPSGAHWSEYSWFLGFPDSYWHRNSSQSQYSSPSTSYWCGHESLSGYGNNWEEALFLEDLTIPESTGSLSALNFQHSLDLEEDHDWGIVHITPSGGGPWDELARFTGTEDWSQESIDLTEYAGDTYTIIFMFRSDDWDSGPEGYRGWFIDDITVTQTPVSYTEVWSDTETIPSLPAGDRLDLVFGETWNPGLANDTKDYLVEVTVQVNDNDNDNNQQTEHVYLRNDHDVGAIDVSLGKAMTIFSDDLDGTTINPFGASWSTASSKWNLDTNLSHSLSTSYWCGEYNPSWKDPTGYGNNWDEELVLQDIDLTDSDLYEVELEFYHYYDIHDSDWMAVEIDYDSGTDIVGMYTGDTSQSWWQETIDLSAHLGKTVDITFRFYSDDDRSNEDDDERDGWYIDDISIVVSPTKASQSTISHRITAEVENFGNIGEQSFNVNASAYLLNYISKNTVYSNDFESPPYNPGGEVIASATGGWNIDGSMSYSNPNSVFCGPYWENWDERLNFNYVNLTNANLAYLYFRNYHQIDWSDDFGFVEIDDGSGYQILETYQDEDTSWEQVVLDLSDYTGGFVNISFHFVSNQWGSWEGWHVDDVEIVKIMADLIYVWGDDEIISYIGAGGQTIVEFDERWLPPTEGDYLVNITTELVTDNKNENDRYSYIFNITNVDDVQVSGINYPLNTQPTGSYYINFTVENLGNIEETFDVNVSVYNQIFVLVWSEEITVDNLGRSETRDVETSSPWIAMIEGDYYVNITSLLTGDDNTTNNQTSVNIFIQDIPDLGAVSVNFPSGTLPQYMSPGYQINATIENFGNTAESLNVNASVYEMTPQSEVFSDDMESGINGWTNNTDSGVDEWHQVVADRNGPTTAWWFGNDTENDQTDDLQDAWLATPMFDLPSDGNVYKLSVLHKYDFQFSNPSTFLPVDDNDPIEQMGIMYATEGGWLEIWTGSDWELLTPEGDYPIVTDDEETSNRIRDFGNGGPPINNNPGHVAFLLSSYGWRNDTFDLTRHAGMPNLQIRFRFSGDGATNYEWEDNNGWWIDDVVITNASLSFDWGTNSSEDVEAGESLDVLFTPNWPAGLEGKYAVIVQTQLPNDDDDSNNRTIGYVTIGDLHDVGVSSIQMNRTAASSNSEMAVNATITNVGSNIESFDVILTVSYKSNGTVIHTYQTAVSSLAVGESRVVDLGTWTTPIANNEFLLIDVTTLLTSPIPDEDNTNNMSWRKFYVNEIDDVEISQANLPQDGGTYPTGNFEINVTVENSGSISQTGFDVTYELYSLSLLDPPNQLFNDTIESGQGGWDWMNPEGGNGDWFIDNSNSHSPSNSWHGWISEGFTILLHEIEFDEIVGYANVSFWHEHDLFYVSGDESDMALVGVIESLGGDEPTWLGPPFSGSSGGWIQSTFEIPSSVYLLRTFTLIFIMGSHPASSGSNWYIDDIVVNVRNATLVDSGIVDTVADVDPDWDQTIDATINIASEGDYRLMLQTNLPEDEFDENNRTVVGFIVANINDTGVSSIDTFSDGAYYAQTTHQPVATVTNYGTQKETNFVVNVTIEDIGGVVYSDEEVISSLDLGSSVQVTFSELWDAQSSSGLHTVTVETRLDTDEDNTNNRTAITIWIDDESPTANAGFDQIEDEASIVKLDASFSTDNDPSFLTTGNFTWSFFDQGVPVELYGIYPTYIFMIPGDYLVTLNTTDHAGNWDIATVWVNVTDAFPPIVGPDNSDTTGTTGELLYFKVNVTDDGGILSVKVLWRYAGEPSFTELELFDDGTHGDGASGDGAYGNNITVQTNSDADIDYYFNASDTAAHTSTYPIGPYFSIPITDDDLPISIGGSGDFVTTTGESFIIYANFTDNIEVTDATIYYKKVDGIVWLVQPMVEGEEGEFSIDNAVLGIDTTNDDTDYEYYIVAIDAALNMGYYGIPALTITVNDNDAPASLDGSGALSITTGDGFQIYANFTDNINVTSADVYYKQIGDTTWQNAPMVESNEGEFKITNLSMGIDTPIDDTDWLYYVNATDAFGNYVHYLAGVAEPWEIVVTDDEDPTIAEVTGDISASTGDGSKTITATIDDNVGIMTALLYYKPISSVDYIALDFSGGTAEIPIPEETPDDILYYIYIEDGEGNPATSATYTITVTTIDTQDPTITEVTGDVPDATTGEDIIITAMIDDNVGITVAWLNYTPIGGTEQSLNFSTGRATIPVAHAVGEITYYIYLADASGKNITSSTYTITVSDNDSPTADAGEDISAEEGTAVTLDASDSTDNLGIAGLTYKWMFIDDAQKELTGINPAYTFEAAGTYIITLEVSDEADNSDIDTIVITVEDTTPPATPTGLQISVSGRDGDALALTWNANTEADLAGYYLYKSTTSGTGFTKLNTELITSTSYIDTGLSVDTTYYYYLIAIDRSGNPSSVSSEAFATTDKDTDGDGIGDSVDTDDDDDGIFDDVDDFPKDSTEWLDSDNDGTGNNADTDDDNDGVEDQFDLDSLDPNVKEAKAKEAESQWWLIIVGLAIGLIVGLILAISSMLKKKGMEDEIPEMPDERTGTGQSKGMPQLPIEEASLEEEEFGEEISEADGDEAIPPSPPKQEVPESGEKLEEVEESEKETSRGEEAEEKPDEGPEPPPPPPAQEIPESTEKLKEVEESEKETSFSEEAEEKPDEGSEAPPPPSQEIPESAEKLEKVEEGEKEASLGEEAEEKPKKSNKKSKPSSRKKKTKGKKKGRKKK